MAKPTPPTDPDYTAWEAGLRARCRGARVSSGTSLIAADAAGLPQASVARVETGLSRNVYLDQVASMADCYATTVAWLIFGDDYTGKRQDPIRQAATFRTRMRADRMAAGISNDAINVLSGQNPTSRAMTRMESGELRRIDLLRCWRAARTIGVDLRSWLTP